MSGLELCRAAVIGVLGMVIAPARQAPAAAPDIQLFFDAASSDTTRSEGALNDLAARWRNSYTPLVVDLARFLMPSRSPEDLFTTDLTRSMPDELLRRAGETPVVDASDRPRHPARVRLIRFLEKQTGQRFGDDLGRWREWMWSLPYEPHPDHLAFKRALYSRIDPRMGKFFTGRSTIRLDEIDWGGVRVNGIPPLTFPAIVSAAEADWLKDSHVVFGVVVNGEARAYPKRILAWHEMAHDTVGGVPITIVYCTLCGTVIPYRSVVGGKHRTFGTSGLLYRSNKLMFDEETMSLWSTLEGRPVVGPLADSDVMLEPLPVVTTTWGEWRSAHPASRVLSIRTGHDRDYSEGAAYRDYFASDRLMFRVPRIDKRLKNKDEVLALLLPAKGGGRQAMAFAAAALKRQPILQTQHEDIALVVLTTPQGANRVYDAAAHKFVKWRDATHVEDAHGQVWTVREDALVLEAAGATTSLPRRPAFRAFWFGWYAQFPETVLIK